MRKRFFRRTNADRAGQTVVEYTLTTLVLVMVFAGLYAFLQGQLRTLFRVAGIKILTSYY